MTRVPKAIVTIMADDGELLDHFAVVIPPESQHRPPAEVIKEVLEKPFELKLVTAKLVAETVAAA